MSLFEFVHIDSFSNRRFKVSPWGRLSNSGNNSIRVSKKAGRLNCRLASRLESIWNTKLSSPVKSTSVNLCTFFLGLRGSFIFASRLSRTGSLACCVPSSAQLPRLPALIVLPLRFPRERDTGCCYNRFVAVSPAPALLDAYATPLERL